MFKQHNMGNIRFQLGVFATLLYYSCAFHQPVLIFNKEAGHEEVSAFKAWSEQNKKTFSSQADEQAKLSNFVETLRIITLHNNKLGQTWKMGTNRFSDMTFSEFNENQLMLPQNCSATKGNHLMSDKPPPAHKDWRKEGKYVTPVKNQKSCGSCWTFSTTGCLESATAIHVPGNPLFSLSEQQLVDCAQAFNNHGCSGGLPSQAFEYIKYNNGLMNETAYPYVGKDGTCKFQASKSTGFVKSVVNITEGAEDQILDAVAFTNPVSIAFEVTKDFQSYKSGIYSSKTCGTRPDQVNHAVLVVGYGTDAGNGMDYWIIKNSWGADWGLNGYFLMERGVNMCGIATCASYPVVI